MAMSTLQERALRFLVAPAEYADWSWWPAPLIRAFGPQTEFDPQASAYVSSWLRKTHGLANDFDFDFEPRAKRFWLLPCEAVRRVAAEVGVAAYRAPIRHCVTRAARAQLQSSLGDAMLAFALTESAAVLAEGVGPATSSERLPSLSDCQDFGARCLLDSIEPHDGPIAKRARLMFSRSVSASNALASAARPRLSCAAIARAQEILPSWRWLFS